MLQGGRGGIDWDQVGDAFRRSTGGSANKPKQKEEEFYGFGDFFKVRHVVHAFPLGTSSLLQEYACLLGFTGHLPKLTLLNVWHQIQDLEETASNSFAQIQNIFRVGSCMFTPTLSFYAYVTKVVPLRLWTSTCTDFIATCSEE